MLLTNYEGMQIKITMKYCFISIVFQSFFCVRLFEPHGLQHARFPCSSPSPRGCSNSHPLSIHPTISSSIVPFSSCIQSFPAPGSFLKSQLFTSGGQSIRASASVLPVKIQDSISSEDSGLNFLEDGLVGSPCSPRDSQESSPTPQFKSINSSALSFLIQVKIQGPLHF